jgi:hypothetical protein
MFKLHFEITDRGFLRADFEDLYGNDCSIQESSLASEDAIWLGVGNKRMHLSREQAKSLLPYLHTFVETGSLVSRDDN